MEIKEHRITFRLDTKRKNHLEKLKQQKNLSTSQITRRALETYFRQEALDNNTLTLRCLQIEVSTWGGANLLMILLICGSHISDYQSSIEPPTKPLI